MAANADEQRRIANAFGLWGGEASYRLAVLDARLARIASRLSRADVATASAWAAAQLPAWSIPVADALST
jgi:hypothetical protein